MHEQVTDKALHRIRIRSAVGCKGTSEMALSPVGLAHTRVQLTAAELKQ
jgi:hypothetical protein